MKQQTQQTSWWLNKNRQELNAYANAHAIEMSRTNEGRGIDATQGLREKLGSAGHRSAIRLGS